MSDLQILREKHPDVADFLEQWRNKYQRSYNLEEKGEQACLYEGVLEMARHLALASKQATVRLDVSNAGVCGLHIQTEAK